MLYQLKVVQLVDILFQTLVTAMLLDVQQVLRLLVEIAIDALSLCEGSLLANLLLLVTGLVVEDGLGHALVEDTAIPSTSSHELAVLELLKLVVHSIEVLLLLKQVGIDISRVLLAFVGDLIELVEVLPLYPGLLLNLPHLLVHDDISWPLGSIPLIEEL